MREMGIKIGGQILIKKLRVEVSVYLYILCVFVLARNQYRIKIFDRPRPLLMMRTSLLLLALQQVR